MKIQRLDVPDAVRAGSEVRLTCDYDLEVSGNHLLSSGRANEHFNAVFVSKVMVGNSIFRQIVYFALNLFVNLHLIRFEILELYCINYPLAIFCAGSNSGHNQVVQGLPRVLQIRPKELSRAEKVFCPTKTLSECKLDIKSLPFTGHTHRNICATLRVWC